MASLSEELMKMFPPSGSSTESSNAMVTTLPLIGRVQFVRDKKGMMQIGFVFWYWIYGTFTSLYIIILPQHADGRISGFFVALFLTVSILCLASLIRAATLNPGRIPQNIDESMIESQTWYFCQKCNRKRPPRAHHCRRCGQCVMRMDHHCPWINNCVGEENHYAFFLLLLYAFLLSAMTFILCMLHFWVYPKCQNCNKDAFYMRHSIWFLYLLVFLAVNMALMMGIQLIGQHFNLIVDKTTLENMQSPLDPSTISFRNLIAAYEELCGGRRATMFLWFLPCRRRGSVHRLPSTHTI